MEISRGKILYHKVTGCLSVCYICIGVWGRGIDTSMIVCIRLKATVACGRVVKRGVNTPLKIKIWKENFSFSHPLIV